MGAARRGVCPIASTQVSGFSLRAAGDGDGDALAKLGAAAADTGAIRVAPHFLHDPLEVLRASQPEAPWVLAETDDGEVVGAGLIDFDRVEVEGEIYRSAHLSSLMVGGASRRSSSSTCPCACGCSTRSCVFRRATACCAPSSRGGCGTSRPRRRRTRTLGLFAPGRGSAAATRSACIRPAGPARAIRPDAAVDAEGKDLRRGVQPGQAAGRGAPGAGVVSPVSSSVFSSASRRGQP